MPYVYCGCNADCEDPMMASWLPPYSSEEALITGMCIRRFWQIPRFIASLRNTSVAMQMPGKLRIGEGGVFVSHPEMYYQTEDAWGMPMTIYELGDDWETAEEVSDSDNEDENGHEDDHSRWGGAKKNKAAKCVVEEKE
jgi:hypothetical protein